MKTCVNYSQAKELDQLAQDKFGISYTQLLEIAGFQLACFIKKQCPKQNKMAIVFGKGNNGADALVAARYLLGWGYGCFLFSPYTKSKLTKESAKRLEALDVFQGQYKLFFNGEGDVFFKVCQTESVTLIVDALFGVGLSQNRPFLAPVLSCIQAINQLNMPVFSVDVPSGLCEDVLDDSPVVLATKTITFAAQKQALLNHASYAGDVSVVDIGIPKQAYDKLGLFFPF